MSDDDKQQVKHFEGKWINPVSMDEYVWVPAGEYPVYCDLLNYAENNYEDRMVRIGRRAMRGLTKFLEEEGVIEKEFIKQDDGMEEMAHRHLDLLEKMIDDE